MALLSKMWEEVPFPATGEDSDLLVWLINYQQRSVLRWQFLFVSLMITFLTYVITGKLAWGIP